MPKYSVVIPVYNEAATIEQILLRVQEVKIDKEIVVVDDCSTDGTKEFLKLIDSKKLKVKSFKTPNLKSNLLIDNINIFYNQEKLGRVLLYIKVLKNQRVILLFRMLTLKTIRVIITY